MGGRKRVALDTRPGERQGYSWVLRAVEESTARMEPAPLLGEESTVRTELECSEEEMSLVGMVACPEAEALRAHKARVRQVQLWADLMGLRSAATRGTPESRPRAFHGA